MLGGGRWPGKERPLLGCMFLPARKEGGESRMWVNLEDIKLSELKLVTKEQDPCDSTPKRHLESSKSWAQKENGVPRSWGGQSFSFAR
jgi:hypothetical protein